jgi:hypothetical protein
MTADSSKEPGTTSNVVDLGAFQKPRDAAENQQNRQIIGETREMVLAKLSESLRSSLDKIEDELFTMAEKATDRDLQNTYLEARMQAKARRTDIESTFRNTFVDLFNGKVQGQPEKSDKNPLDLSSLELSLVDEGDLESSLAVKELVRRLKGAVEAELGPLGQRMGYLLNRGEIDADDVPASPHNVAEALKNAIEKMDAPPKVKMTLLKLFEQMFAPQLKRIYGDLNAHLVARQILPQLRVGYRRPVAIGGAARPGPGPGGGEASDAAPLPGAPIPPGAEGQPATAPAEPDLFSMLQSLMMPGGMPGFGAPAMPGMPGMAGMPGVPGVPSGFPGAAPPGMVGMPPGYATGMPQFMPMGGGAPIALTAPGGFASALNALQQGQQLDFWSGAGLDPSLLLSGGAAPVWGDGYPLTGTDPAAEVAGAYAAGGVPVAMYAPPVNVIRQIRQSPVGAQINSADGVTIDIVAMLFDYLFEDAEVQAPVKALVSKLQIPILKVALVDKGFFTQKEHAVRLYLDRLAEVSIGCPPNVSPEDELFKRIDQTVTTVVNEYQDDLTLFTRELHALERFYADFQQRAADKEQASVVAAEKSAQAEAVRYAIEVEVATHSTAPGVPLIAQALISEVLPPLLAKANAETGVGGEHWQETMAVIEDLVWSVQPKSTPEDRKKLVQMLPRLLKRLREGMREAGLDSAKGDAFVRSLASLHAAAVKNEETAPPKPPAAEEPLDIDLSAFEPEVKSSRVETDSGLAIEEIRLVKQSRELRTALDQYDEYEAMVKGLARDTWVEFKRSDESFLRVKLTFVSPEYGVYVFTNPQLPNALSVSREALLVQLKLGEARIVEEKSLFDRAVGGLLSRLRAGKAPN